MRPLALRLTVVLSAVILALSARPVAADPPPPSDAELTKYIAVQDALVADAARRNAICALLAEDAEGDSGPEDDLAEAARRVESNAILGPLLRHTGLTGRRYVELSLQVASVLIGAAIANEADAAERAAGRPQKSREALLASSPVAPPILARQQDLTRALSALAALCAESEDDSGISDEEEPEDMGRR